MKQKIILLTLTIFISLCLTASALAQIPTVRITTQNDTVPLSRTDRGCGNNNRPGFGMAINVSDYVLMTGFQVEAPGSPAYNFLRNNEPDSIRRRGNSTMTMPKIPFRVKFDKRTSLFGKEAARSWVLLANYYDTTMALNAMAFELGRRLGMEFTPTFQFVDVYLNGDYRGIYQLTEQIQANPGRVNIDKDFGWLAEFDYHAPASDKCTTHFTTSRYNFGTFIKSPEDLPNTAAYAFVRNDINRLVEAMADGGFPNNDYRDLIDLESFAKYVLIQMLIDNFDFNSKVQAGGLPGSNFAYKDYGGKIKAGPLWDFDLAGGVLVTNFPRHYQTYQDQITPRHPFYQRFFEDPVFLAKWKKAWDRHQSDFNAMPAFIDSIANLLAPRIEANFASYTGGSSGGWGPQPTPIPLTLQQYRNEVEKLKTWWGNRVQFFGQQITAMNIDTSKDIGDTQARAAPRSNFINGSSVAAVKNGVDLRVVNNATVRLFRLDGREIRRIKLTGGSHAVRFGSLPKGMYIARIAIDGNKRDLRVMVR